MKKLYTLLAAVLMTSALYAQEGSMYAGGALGFGNDQWKIGPEVGTWLSDELQVGAVLSFSGSDIGGTKTTNIAPHVYGRMWFPVGERFSLYVGANARFVSQKQETAAGDNSDSNFDAFVDAGFALSVAERWGIVGRVASVGYIGENFIVDLNMSPASMFNVGIYYTFKQ